MVYFMRLFHNLRKQILAKCFLQTFPALQQTASMEKLVMESQKSQTNSLFLPEIDCLSFLCFDHDLAI